MFISIRAKVLTDETGVYTEIPALLAATGILEPLIDYFLHRSHDRSLEWMRKVTRSVRLFLEYIQLNPAERDPHLNIPRQSKQEFHGKKNTNSTAK